MTIEFSELKSGDKVVLGVSGGADSIFLLHQCIAFGLKPIVVHINHKLRGRASDGDAKFVEKVCKKQRLECLIIEKDFRKLKGNTEDNARRFRYQIFEKIRADHHAKWILTAHHQSDQIETVLFNMARGCTLQGFKGITEIDIDHHLYRPLLHTSRKTILSYLKHNRLRFREDKSNLDINFSRNRIRHKIIPEFTRINSSFVKTFSNTITNLNENLGIIEKLTNQWVKKNVTDSSFSLDKLLDQPEIMQKHILTKLHPAQSLTSHQLREILKTLNQKRSNRKKEFGKDHLLKILKNDKTNERVVVIAKQKQ